MSEESAALRLAKVRERHQMDFDGREEAAQKLLERFLSACEVAGLNLGKEDGYHRIALWHPPKIKVLLSTSAGDILMDPGAQQKKIDGLEYDPIRKQFTGTDPEGPDALDIIAAAVGGKLDERARPKAKQER